MTKSRKIAEPTLHLRWRGDTLEQLWEIRHVGLKGFLTNNLYHEWRPVPTTSAGFEHMTMPEEEQENGCCNNSERPGDVEG